MERKDGPVIVFVNGAKAPLCVDLVKCMIIDHHFQLFAIASITLFSVIRPYQTTHLDRWQAITIIAIMGCLVFAIYLIALCLVAKISARFKIAKLYSIWLLLGGAFFASFFGQESLLLFGKQPTPLLETTLIAIFHLVMFIALETVFVIVILPNVLVTLSSIKNSESFVSDQKITQSEQEDLAPVEQLPIVIISGKRFVAHDIRKVTAQEHYISVLTFDEQDHFVRGRMRDFLIQIPEDLGYCIHRSHWVAWTSIQRVDVDKDNMVVELGDNIALPVARGRRSDFIARWKRKASGRST